MKPLDDGLKQRVVGALVLLALAIIFIPVLFDRDPIAPVNRMSQIPQAPTVVAVAIPEPVIPASAASAPSPEIMFIPDESKAEAIAADAPTVKPNTGTQAWVLQVASFRQREHANTLRDRLIAAGYPAFVREVPYKNASIIRVYVGPKLDKQVMNEQKMKVDKDFGLDSLLLPFTPE